VFSLGYTISNSFAAPKFAAKVNGVGIKRVTLEAAVNNFVDNQKLFGIDVKKEDEDKLREGILEELISAELLYQESKKSDPGDLTGEIEKQYEEIQKGFGSGEELEGVLKEKGITVKDLKEDIKKASI